MSNSILCTLVGNVVKTKALNGRYGYFTKYLLELAKDLDKTCTYILIFSVYQNEQLNAFEKFEHINILFKSKPCLNRVGGHQDSKNTVVVFELKDSYPGGESTAL